MNDTQATPLLVASPVEQEAMPDRAPPEPPKIDLDHPAPYLNRELTWRGTSRTATRSLAMAAAEHQ